MNIFLDSSILIEYEKSTLTKLLDALQEQEHQLYIHTIIKVLASHNSDFALACQAENVETLK
jgi:hypothetical protein